MEWQQWSAEGNVCYSLNEIFDGEEQSALQVSGATSLSNDHAASQLLAPCTHHRHCNLDQMFYPDSLLPLRITIPGGFAETEFRDVCFACFKAYEQDESLPPLPILYKHRTRDEQHPAETQVPGAENH